MAWLFSCNLLEFFTWIGHLKFVTSWFLGLINMYLLSVTWNLSQVGHYLVDVLWCQPIKLIQVVSTSEFHEY